MGEFDFLIFTIISLFENFKDESLYTLLECNNNQIELNNLIKKQGIDQSKILRKSAEYYNNFHSIGHQNNAIYNLIINYFNK